MLSVNSKKIVSSPERDVEESFDRITVNLGYLEWASPTISSLPQYI